MIRTSDDPLVNRICFLCDFLFWSAFEGGVINVKVRPFAYALNDNSYYGISSNKKFSIECSIVPKVVIKKSNNNNFIHKQLEPMKVYYEESK